METTCKRNLLRPIPTFNLVLLREKYPEHRPPLSREIVDSWDLPFPLPPCLYEYLTEFSDTVYVSSDRPNGTIVKPPTDDDLICLDDDVHIPKFLELSTGNVRTYFSETDEEDLSKWYIDANSFEEYIMKQFQEKEPKCNCQPCIGMYAANYNILRIFSGLTRQT